MTNSEVNALTAGLRRLADFLDANPNLCPAWSGHSVNLFPSDELWAEVIRSGHGLKKVANGNYFSLVKDFGGNVTLEWNKNREQVCKRVKIGEKIIPAVPERIIPAQPETVVEEFDWVCPDSLLKATAPEEPADEEPVVFQQG